MALVSAEINESPGSGNPALTSRFGFVDALRGIAALLVVLFHLYRAGPLYESLSGLFPKPLGIVLETGWAGVAIFFVISGFVIAYSLRSAHVTPGYTVRFAVRRAVRLDPPYWSAIVLFIVIRGAALVVFRHPIGDLPDFSRILANMFYLQNVLGSGDIVTVSWTLCLEIQFYLVLVALTGVSSWWGDAHGLTGRRAIQALVFVPLLLVSTALASARLGTGGWFVEYWYLFFLGCVTCWAGVGSLPLRMWIAAGLLVLVTGILSSEVYPFAGLATAALILTAAKRRALHQWLGGSVFQYLGRISYSLYLVHTLSGSLLVAVLYSRVEHSLLNSLILFLIGILVSIAFADIFHRVIEAPSIRFARRVRLDGSSPTLFSPRPTESPIEHLGP